MKLSVVIPVYNERTLIPQIIERVMPAPLPKGLTMEIVVVDDCSTDGTREWLSHHFASRADVMLCLQERNAGKGAALRRRWPGSDAASTRWP